MLDCVKSPFVTHAALFLGSTSEDVNEIRDWEYALGVSKRKDNEFEVISCLTIVVRSEKERFRLVQKKWLLNSQNVAKIARF